MAARVDNLLLQGLSIGERLLERILIWAPVDDEKSFTLLDEGIVLDAQIEETIADFGCYLDEIARTLASSVRG